MNDWEFIGPDGKRWIAGTLSSWSLTIYTFQPKVPVPYKRNKHRYGR